MVRKLRELLFCNLYVYRTNYSSDSALFSLSQRQHSQNEFSQVRTQDLFTQNQTGSGSQSEVDLQSYTAPSNSCKSA